MPGHCCPRCVDPGAGRKVLGARRHAAQALLLQTADARHGPFLARDTEAPGMDSKIDQLTLHTLLGNYPNAAALKDGRIQSALVRLDFDDVKVPSTAFKPLVREGKYDLGELAIVTYLQAKAAGKPYVLLPIPVMGRGQHHTLVYNSERGHIAPEELKGRRVGVRAYTVTTGAWVRGILAEDYGVETPSMRWVTFEDPHV